MLKRSLHRQKKSFYCLFVTYISSFPSFVVSFFVCILNMAQSQSVVASDQPVVIEEIQLPGKIADNQSAMFSSFVENMAEHTKEKRNATFWGFYKPIQGDEKGQIMICCICNPEIGSSDATRILKSSKRMKGILRYKPSAGSSGLRKHISISHSSVSCTFF